MVSPVLPAVAQAHFIDDIDDFIAQLDAHPPPPPQFTLGDLIALITAPAPPTTPLLQTTLENLLALMSAPAPPTTTYPLPYPIIGQLPPGPGQAHPDFNTGASYTTIQEY